MSYRQKGLSEASLVTFINCQKRICVKHFVDNVVNNFRAHPSITTTLWRAARTYDYERLSQHMDNFNAID